MVTQTAAITCKRCKSAPPVAGKTLCEACAEEGRERWRARKAQLQAAGLCYRCAKQPPIKENGICEDCRAHKNGTRRAQRQAEADQLAYLAKVESVQAFARFLDVEIVDCVPLEALR